MKMMVVDNGPQTTDDWVLFVEHKQFVTSKNSLVAEK